MAKRKIIKIDDVKCNGCGVCIPNCPEGAMQVIDGKARLISDLFCDGLGACLGSCPRGAITIEERDAQTYDERLVMNNIIKQGNNVINAHLEHLKAHGENAYLKQALDYLKEKDMAAYLGCGFASHIREAKIVADGCPGSRVLALKDKVESVRENARLDKQESELRQWPVQIMLIAPSAPYLNNSDLLIAADCVGFAYADFHRDLLRGKVLLVGCPKLDDIGIYREKFLQIFKNNNVKSVTYAHMEVPCCFGMVNIINDAIAKSAKQVKFTEVTISIKGKRIG